MFAEPGKSGRPKGKSGIKPIAPYHRDPAKAAAHAFCRETGERVCPTQLRTYALALAEFHISSESKFENGQPLDRGPTKRRHVQVNEYVLIGKEANKVGESGEAEPDHSRGIEIEFTTKNQPKRTLCCEMSGRLG